MPIELVDTRARFEALAAEWEGLYRDDPSSHVFLSHRWLSDLYRRRPGVCTLVWREGGPDTPPGAVLPLRRELVLDREGRRFRGELLMAGNHWADYTGVLCRRSVEAHALPALGAALQTLPWERLRFDSLRISPERLALLGAAFDTDAWRTREHHPRDNEGETRLDVAPRVALPARFDDWLDTLGAGTRQRLRRYRRKLDAGARFAIRASTDKTRASDLAAFRRLWLARWEERKGASAATKADKYVAIIADGLASAQLGLDLLDADGEPVAVAAAYLDPVRATASFYVGARDATFRALPAGLLLHAHRIERAIAERYRVYDLLRGDEHYKYALGGVDDKPLVTRHLHPTPPTPARVMLDPCHRDAALAMIERALDTARSDTIGRLYSQLLESWPEEPRVLGRYRAWLAAREARSAPRAARRVTAARSPARER